MTATITDMAIEFTAADRASMERQLDEAVDLARTQALRERCKSISRHPPRIRFFRCQPQWDRTIWSDPRAPGLVTRH